MVFNTQITCQILHIYIHHGGSTSILSRNPLPLAKWLRVDIGANPFPSPSGARRLKLLKHTW